MCLLALSFLVLELAALLDRFRLGVSPDDPTLEAGRRVIFNTVVTLGFLPNIPLLFVTEVEGGALDFCFSADRGVGPRVEPENGQ